jgi:hypothetical protein
LLGEFKNNRTYDSIDLTDKNIQLTDDFNIVEITNINFTARDIEFPAFGFHLPLTATIGEFKSVMKSVKYDLHCLLLSNRVEIPVLVLDFTNTSPINDMTLLSELAGLRAQINWKCVIMNFVEVKPLVLKKQLGKEVTWFSFSGTKNESLSFDILSQVQRFYENWLRISLKCASSRLLRTKMFWALYYLKQRGAVFTLVQLSFCHLRHDGNHEDFLLQIKRAMIETQEYDTKLTKDKKLSWTQLLRHGIEILINTTGENIKQGMSVLLCNT